MIPDLYPQEGEWFRFKLKDVEFAGVRRGGNVEFCIWSEKYLMSVDVYISLSKITIIRD